MPGALAFKGIFAEGKKKIAAKRGKVGRYQLKVLFFALEIRFSTSPLK
jgi:hypothetical protein